MREDLDDLIDWIIDNDVSGDSPNLVINLKEFSKKISQIRKQTNQLI